MKKINPLKLAIGVLGLSSVASLVGSISGTIAWYAYQTRALVSYTGTSAQSSAQLQIGIKSKVEIPSLADDALIEVVETNDCFYYFTHLGSGGMPSSIIGKYLGGNGYATSVLEPVSTYTYSTGGDFKLKNCPTTNRPLERSEAPTSKYVKIPFAFRSFTTGENGIANATSVRDEKIYLSGAETKAEEGSIDKALRMYIDRNGKDDNNVDLGDFIFNPNSNSAGSTKVGGVLDLSGNGFFDYDNNPENTSTSYMREFLYGDCTFKDGVSWNSFVQQKNADSGLDDINDTKMTEQTTFTSKHRKNTYHLPCDDTHPLDSFVDIGTSSYLGKSDVLLTKYDKEEENPPFLDKYVCKTDTEITTVGNNVSSYVGTFDLTIYIEGWDFNTINQHGNKEFNLGLTFAIDIN